MSGITKINEGQAQASGNSIQMNTLKGGGTTPLVANNTPISKVKDLTDQKSDPSSTTDLTTLKTVYYATHFFTIFLGVLLFISIIGAIPILIYIWNSTPDYGVTNILHRAVTDKSYKTAAFILGFVPLYFDSVNRDGKTALMLAHQNKDDKMLALLLWNFGINLSKIDEPIEQDNSWKKLTPLEHLVRKVEEGGLSDIRLYTNIAQILIERGAKYDNKVGGDLFRAGIKANDTKLLKLLIEKGAKYDGQLAIELFKTGIEANDSKLLGMLIKKWDGAFVNPTCKAVWARDSTTALQVAIKNMDVELAKALRAKNIELYPEDKAALVMIENSEDPKLKEIYSIFNPSLFWKILGY